MVERVAREVEAEGAVGVINQGDGVRMVLGSVERHWEVMVRTEDGMKGPAHLYARSLIVRGHQPRDRNPPACCQVNKGVECTRYLVSRGTSGDEPSGAGAP
jgi:hypothetical protein